MMRYPKNRAPIHPGVYLRSAISRAELPRKEAADGVGISCQHLSALMDGQQSITSHTALRLEKMFGVSAGFWLSSQLAWDRWRDA